MPKIDGLCEPPVATDKTIYLRKQMTPKRLLEVAIHEALHACDWDKSEVAITEIAEDISDFVWRIGYRLDAEHFKKVLSKSS
jgi:hypothetical protein